jgi:hypothetical protein
MVSEEASDGAGASTYIQYLDAPYIDAPRLEGLNDLREGFRRLGEEGWRLVQVVEQQRAARGDASEGAIHYYFTRRTPPRR